MFGPKNAEESLIFAIEEFVADSQYCIQKVMNEKKVSRSELARRLGCTPANVTQMLSENSNLRLDTVARIFHALEDRCVLQSEFLETTNRAQVSRREYERSCSTVLSDAEVSELPVPKERAS